MFHEFSIDYRVSIRSFHYLASRGIDWTAIETDLLDRSDTNLYRRPSKLRSFEDKASRAGKKWFEISSNIFPPYKGGTRTFGISRNWRAIMPRSGIIDRDRKKKKIASQKFRSRGKEKAITLLDLGTMAHQRICRKIIPLFGIECKPDCTWRKSGESNESNFSDGISILVSLEFIETLFGLNCRFN